MNFFTKTDDGFYLLTIFAKKTILDVWLACEYAFKIYQLTFPGLILKHSQWLFVDKCDYRFLVVKHPKVRNKIFHL